MRRAAGSFTSLHPFDADTHIEPGAQHTYRATVSSHWNALGGGPLGGYVLAICTRALEAELSHPDALTLSALFMRPTAPGAVEIAVDEIRSGRQLSNAEARLTQDGKERLRVLATFTDLGAARGRTLKLSEPPALSPPEDSIEPFPRGLPGVDVADRVEYRTSEPVGWAVGEPGGKCEAEFWMRFRERRDFDAAALAFFVDAAAPIVLELGERGSRTLELGVHFRARPAAGWLSCRVSTRHVIGGFHEENFEIWDSTGTLVAQSRQLAILTA